MAGSLSHIVDANGKFTMELIENLGDAHEALEECFNVIAILTNGDKEKVNPTLKLLGFPQLDTDLRIKTNTW